MPGDLLRVGVIGGGSIAQHAHLPSIQRLPKVKLMALSDAYLEVAQKVGAANGLDAASAYSDHRPILDRKDIDAVAVCAPTTMHADITVQALKAGKHVLVEKPMAVTSDEAAAMVAAAEASGNTLMVAYNHTYDAATMYVKDMIERGEIGDILFAEVFFYEDVGAWTAGALSHVVRAKDQKSFWLKYTDPYENLREYIHNFDSHVINLMRVLIGEPKGIEYCQWIQGVGLWAMLNYGSYKTGFKNVLQRQPNFEKGIEICGKKKRVRIDLAPPLLRYAAGRVRVIDVEAKSTNEPAMPMQWPFQNEWEHFVSCVLEGRQPLTHGRMAMEDVLLAEKMAAMAVGR